MDTSPALVPIPARRRWWLWPLLIAVTAVALIVAAVWHFLDSYPNRQLQRGTLALAARDWEGVEEYVRRLDAAGAAEHAAVLRGELLLVRRRPDEALREFNAVRSDGPLQLRAAGKAGKCLLDLGEVREAHRVLTHVVGQSPDDADAHRALASIAYDLGQMPTAVFHLERVAALDPKDPRPHRLIGLIYKDLNQTEKAEAAYAEALRRGLTRTARTEVAVELAQTRLEAKKYAEALAALDAEAASPEPAEAAVRVEALRGVGERAKAVALADHMIAAAPNDGPFHRLRGQLHLDAGETAAAIADLEQAAARAPTHYQTYFLLAQAYAAAGRGPDADRLTKRANELRADLDRITTLTTEAMDKPWDAAVRRQLADAAERLGDPKLAATWRAAAVACARSPH